MEIQYEVFDVSYFREANFIQFRINKAFIVCGFMRDLSYYVILKWKLKDSQNNNNKLIKLVILAIL